MRACVLIAACARSTTIALRRDTARRWSEHFHRAYLSHSTREAQAVQVMAVRPAIPDPCGHGYFAWVRAVHARGDPDNRPHASHDREFTGGPASATRAC